MWGLGGRRLARAASLLGFSVLAARMLEPGGMLYCPRSEASDLQTCLGRCQLHADVAVCDASRERHGVACLASWSFLFFRSLAQPLHPPFPGPPSPPHPHHPQACNTGGRAGNIVRRLSCGDEVEPRRVWVTPHHTTILPQTSLTSDTALNTKTCSGVQRRHGILIVLYIVCMYVSS